LSSVIGDKEMASRSFEELRVYRLAEELADGVWNIVQGWKITARDTVGKHIIRSADRIGADIAEGFVRGSYQDNRRFIRIARGSLCETRHWLRRAFRRQLLTDTQINELRGHVDSLGPQLNAYLKSTGRNCPKS
jgi:four helix bundle protein